jgi:hypothetical protein
MSQMRLTRMSKKNIFIFIFTFSFYCFIHIFTTLCFDFFDFVFFVVFGKKTVSPTNSKKNKIIEGFKFKGERLSVASLPVKPLAAFAPFFCENHCHNLAMRCCAQMQPESLDSQLLVHYEKCQHKRNIVCEQQKKE